MSFKVGDRVVAVGCQVQRQMNGETGTVVGEEFLNTKYMTPAVSVQWDAGFTHPCTTRRLRKIDPPSDEFQPAEPEFVSDLLKRLGRVSA